jgi:hypothetical protein
MAIDEQALDEQKAIDEATKEYDALVATLILIATSNKSKSEKNSLINEWKTKMQSFNAEFSVRHSEVAYTKMSEEALKEAQALESSIKNVKKKLSPSQKEELKVLSEELKLGLNKRLDVLIQQAKELTIKEELVKIREGKLGMTNATDRIQLTPSRSKPNLVFTNAKGKIVSMQAVMKLTVGDQLWKTVTSSQRSQWLLLGFKYVQHLSVMDGRTTQICIDLNTTRRDLRKDQLPPMHKGCRSKVKLLKDGWNQAIFLKNF